MSALREFTQVGARGFYQPQGQVTFEQAIAMVAAGLAHARELGLDRVDARCDARLIVEQVTGGREPANPQLRDLCRAVRDAAERIGTVVFTWVPAEANGRAHALVADALAP